MRSASGPAIVEQRGELAQEDRVGPAHEEELAGLGDVLGRRAPVHVSARVALADAVELPDQRHERMAGARESRPDGLPVQEREVRLARDLLGGQRGDDAELGLGLRQRRLHVEPRLVARRLGEERADAGIRKSIARSAPRACGPPLGVVCSSRCGVLLSVWCAPSPRAIVGYTGPLSPTRSAAGRPALVATGWMIGSLTSFVLMTVAARQLSGRLGTFEILFLRSLVALAVLVALRPRLGAGAFATRRLGLHVARNLVHFCGQYAWVWGIAITPLAVVTAIEFTSPVWVALLAALILGERLTPPRWTAIAGGDRRHPPHRPSGSPRLRRGRADRPRRSLLLRRRHPRRQGAPAHGPRDGRGLLHEPHPASAGPRGRALRVGVAGARRSPVGRGHRRDVADRALLDGARPVARRCELRAADRLPPPAPDRRRRAPLYGERIDGWTVAGALLIFAGNYWSVRAETRATAAPVFGVPCSTRR